MMDPKTDGQQLQLSAALHEIRNPLTLIQSYLQLFEKHHPEASDDFCWQTAKSELLYLRVLLQDISACHGEITLKKEPVPMTDWLLAYAKTISLLFAPHSEILLATQIAKDLPVLEIDGSRMRQLLDNLVRNGIEAIKNASAFTTAHACVALYAYMAQDMLCIAVTDTGCGVSSAMRECLFTPFCTDKPEGTGLGLPICRRIAELHGGQLTLSFSGRGKTQFLLSLPAQSRR